MAIAKNPKRNHSATIDRDAEAFISAASKAGTESDQEQNKKPIMIRIDPAILTRVDAAAKRLGISRSAFIVSSTAMRLEEMD